jgi:hypothetical protein
VLKQRVFQIAAGYEDANDAKTLRDAPLVKLLLDRLPETGAPWASQPTMSRFDNRVSRTDLSRMTVALFHQCIASSATPPRGIVLAVDDTEAPVHGGQEQARFVGSDGGYGFLPCHGYAGLSGRLSTTMLQAKRCTGAQMLAVLKRLGTRLRHAWPDTLLLCRGESHFASPAGMPWIAAQSELHYVTGLTSHAVLKARACEVVEQGTRASARWGRTGTRLHATRSQAQTWARPRRVVITVAVSAQGGNTRCVVTAMEQARTKVLSQNISCARGQADNAMKEHKLSRKADRTSCHRFKAQQVRVLWHAAASVLLATLRREVLRTTPWASAPMETSQFRVLKRGARVQEGKDGLTMSLPSACPVAPGWRRSLPLLTEGRPPSRAGEPYRARRRCKGPGLVVSPRGRRGCRGPAGHTAPDWCRARTT